MNGDPNIWSINVIDDFCLVIPFYKQKIYLNLILKLWPGFIFLRLIIVEDKLYTSSLSDYLIDWSAESYRVDIEKQNQKTFKVFEYLSSK